MPQKVSVTLITYNEEANIERCLDSLGWADEIVVVDSFSEDATVELCRRYTDKVFQEQWQGYGRQKNLCAGKASNRWILNIDADEVVSPECRESILKTLAEEPRFAIYDFPRKNYFGDRWVRYAGWYPDRIARLYDSSRVRFSETPVHERLEGAETVGRLEGPLLHYSYRDMHDYIDRQNRYSTLFARGLRNRGKQATWSDLVFRPPLAFLKVFVLKQGFREGSLGFFLAMSSLLYTFLKYAKSLSAESDPQEK